MQIQDGKLSYISDFLKYKTPFGLLASKNRMNLLIAIENNIPMGVPPLLFIFLSNI